jgi:hypothetical protein
VGHCGAGISNIYIYMYMSSSFAPEELETTFFQNGCLAFRSPASSDLQSSVMFVSFQVWPGVLQSGASSTSLLPVGIQTPVASAEIGEAGLHGYGECLFFSGSIQSDKSDNLGSEMCL